MDCILHIGTEKTGTTSIQSFLNLNRQLLVNEARTLYTQSLGIEDNRGLSFLGYNPEQNDDYNFKHQILTPEATVTHQQFLFDQVQAEINQHQSLVDRVIFSSEHLQSRLHSEAQLLRLKKWLERLNLNVIQVVLYIRNPVETAFSLYSTVVKGGAQNATILAHDHPYINRICNHRNTVTRWGAIFSSEKITVRAYRKDLFFQGELLSDFIHTVNLPENLNYQMPQKRNLSLDYTGLEVLKRLNEKIPNHINGKPNSLRPNITPFFEKHCSLGPKINPPTDVIDQYDLFYKDSNEWVRSHFFPNLETMFTPPLAQDKNFEIDLDEIANLLSDILLNWDKKNRAA